MKTIPKFAFRFCKCTIAALIWCSFALKEESLLIIVFALLLSSALLKIRRAPLILLYAFTVGKSFPGTGIEVDESAMRFAHLLGAFLAGLCLVFIYLFPAIGWWLVLGFAILKTISTLGFCPGEAVYSCYVNGTCSVLRK